MKEDKRLANLEEYNAILGKWQVGVEELAGLKELRAKAIKIFVRR